MLTGEQNGGYARLRRADCLACAHMIDEYARHMATRT